VVAQLDGAAAGAGAARGKAFGLQRLRRIATGADVVKADRKLDRAEAETLMRQLAQNPEVEYVEIDAIKHAYYTPNDARYGEQWGYSGRYGIKADQAWDFARGEGAVVAVIDTGITDHTDLNANILPGYDFITDPAMSVDGDGRDADPSDPGDHFAWPECGVFQPSQNSSWHGTHVAGTIAAVSNNGIGVTGIAPKAKVLPVRVSGRCGAYTSDIIDGMVWAAGLPVHGVPANPHPARVINLSLGSVNSCSKAFQAAIDAVRAVGTVVVAAAGNTNIDVSRISPAGCRGVIAVAASNREGRKTYYSNFGRHITVAAPGGDMVEAAGNGILSTYNSGPRRPGIDVLAYMQGTSMAAPHVAGVAALMLSANPRLEPDRVQSLLNATARPIPPAQCRGGCGGGLVDAAAAVAAAAVAP